MKFNFFLYISIILLLSGCGHNIGTSSKGIGFNLSWTSGSFMPNLSVGYWDINQAVIRGNSIYTVTTSSGGGVTTLGGTAQTVELKSGPQFNEGNVKEVLIEPTVNPDVKIALVKSINTNSTPESSSFSTKTSNAAAASGNELLDVKPLTSGLDKVIETVGNVADNAVTNIPTAITTASSDIKTSSENIKESTENAKDMLETVRELIKKYSFWIVSTLSSILLLLLLYIGKKFFFKKKEHI